MILQIRDRILDALAGNLAQGIFGSHFCCFIFAISFVRIKLTLTFLFGQEKEDAYKLLELRNSPRNIAPN